MSPARRAFVWVFGLSLAVGVIVGIVDLVAPQYATVKLNDQVVTGMTGFVTAACLGGGFGLFFGLVIAGIVKLATRGYTKAT